MIFDHLGNVASQYFIPLKKDSNNLMFFHWYGFKDIENLSDTINEIQLKIHTVDESSYDIKINRLIKFKDDWAIKEYLEGSDSYVPEKEKKIN